MSLIKSEWMSGTVRCLELAGLHRVRQFATIVEFRRERLVEGSLGDAKQHGCCHEPTDLAAGVDDGDPSLIGGGQSWCHRSVCGFWIIAIIVGWAELRKPRPSMPARGLEIYFIDVQGGAATLLVTPERESVLIDSGWPGFDDRDPKRIVHVLKDLAGCDQLDHLVTTHWHRDHFGGVAGLAKKVRIVHFWDRGLPEDRQARARLSRRPARR